VRATFRGGKTSAHRSHVEERLHVAQSESGALRGNDCGDVGEYLRRLELALGGVVLSLRERAQHQREPERHGPTAACLRGDGFANNSPFRRSNLRAAKGPGTPKSIGHRESIVSALGVQRIAWHVSC
jgi:hypothetical protein